MSHPIGLFFVVLIAVFFIATVAWNFVPGWRDKIKGYSTVIEGSIGALISIYGELAGGIQDAQAAGFVPPQLANYVPIAIFLWFIIKRFGTTTPIGQK